MPGKSTVMKGTISQRQLVVDLKGLIDTASSKSSSAHRDIARSKLRVILENEDWRTTHVLNNISSRRCRYIQSIGYWVPSKWTLIDWKQTPRREKRDVEE